MPERSIIEKISEWVIDLGRLYVETVKESKEIDLAQVKEVDTGVIARRAALMRETQRQKAENKAWDAATRRRLLID